MIVPGVCTYFLSHISATINQVLACHIFLSQDNPMNRKKVIGFERTIINQKNVASQPQVPLKINNQQIYAFHSITSDRNRPSGAAC